MHAAATIAVAFLALSAPLKFAAGFAPMIGKDGSVYLPKYSDLACEGSVIEASNVTECQAIAMENGHAYYSFLEVQKNEVLDVLENTAGHCATASSCDVRSASPGWKVYKRWLGALNSTHADVIPSDDGDPKWYCKTQVNITLGSETKKDHATCTSCKEGKAFMMVFHEARTGTCQDYEEAPRTVCALLNQNDGRLSLNGDDFMCTKVMLAQAKVPINMAEEVSTEFRLHIQNNVGGWGRNRVNVARCELRKETVCIAGKCDSQKLARCKEICKLKAWTNPLQLESCSAAACETPVDAPAGMDYGSLACTQIAVTE